jgi:hypothetical protein
MEERMLYLRAVTNLQNAVHYAIRKWVPANARINPLNYLKDVLQRNGLHPINQIELLFPQNWMACLVGLWDTKYS